MCLETELSEDVERLGERGDATSPSLSLARIARLVPSASRLEVEPGPAEGRHPTSAHLVPR